MGSKEVMFFDPSTGKLHTSKPTASADPDKVVAVKMNDPASGGFFNIFATAVNSKGKEAITSFQHNRPLANEGNIWLKLNERLPATKLTNSTLFNMNQYMEIYLLWKKLITAEGVNI